MLELNGCLLGLFYKLQYGVIYTEHSLLSIFATRFLLSANFYCLSSDMSTHHNQAIAYRPEIDGLRAVAVLPVILFHAGFEIFSGGYVGVDIFFVISGYLISSIILKELEQGKFSIVRFYERRARRILPALFFVVVCCLPFAWAWMLPDELKRFGQSMVAVATFSSNIYFWRKTDYFAPAAEEQPLLHTWSLAVEEQYYLLFPLFLILCWRFGKSKVFWLITTAAVLSLGLAEWGWRNQPAANFYLLPTRAWELLIGSLLAFLPKAAVERSASGKMAGPASIAGLALIFCSIFLFNKSTPFPSFYGLLPVSGTVLVIVFASSKNWTGKLLSTRPFVGIGLISYSAYLWHQPIFAFAKVISLGVLSQGMVVSLLCLTFILSVITFRYIETPFRAGTVALAAKKLLFPFSMGVLCILGFSGLITHLNNGFDTRLIQKYNSSEWEEALAVNHGLAASCEYSESFSVKIECVNGEEPNTILWGDSFAMHLAQGMVENQVQFIQATRSVCGPSFFDAPAPRRSVYNKAWSEKCFAFNQSVLIFLKNTKNIKYAVLASPFNQYVEGDYFNPARGIYTPSMEERIGSFSRTVEMLKSLGIRPIIISPPPSPGFNIGACLKRQASGFYTVGDRAKSCNFQTNVLPETAVAVREFVDKISMATSIKEIDFTDLICGEIGECQTRIDNVPLYRDEGHLSRSGSKLLAQKNRMFEDLK